MSSDERPAKIRKLEHAEESAALLNVDIPASTTMEEQTPVTMESGQRVNATESNDCGEFDAEGTALKISKNQLKKQRRQERWESGREDRKQKRKDKLKEKKERHRSAKAQDEENGISRPPPPARAPRRSAGLGTQVPITVIFDCDFEDLMFDNELKSLGLQITRCYSDNRKAKFRAHLALSSFGGKMKERFDGILAQQYTHWKGFRFFEEDFVAVAEKSKEWMTGPKGGVIAGALKSSNEDERLDEQGTTNGNNDDGEIIYLSSESDNILTHLNPNSTYIIGGLVDKNRHKGICHKRATNRSIKTAKLPIGQYLEMNSRQVLVTNHVLEIMLNWMESGDWGQAFMKVMPKRKGGKLIEGANEDSAEGEEDEHEDFEAPDVEIEPQSAPEVIETVPAPQPTNLADVQNGTIGD